MGTSKYFLLFFFDKNDQSRWVLFQKNKSINQIQETGLGCVQHETRGLFWKMRTTGIDIHADWQIGPHS